MMPEPTLVRLSRGSAPLIQPEPQLTHVQIVVLQRLAEGKHHRDIAEAMKIRNCTMRVWVHRIMKKLGVETSAGAVAVALRKGIIK